MAGQLLDRLRGRALHREVRAEGVPEDVEVPRHLQPRAPLRARVTLQERWSARLSGYAREILAGQLKISGDSLRLVALTDDPAMLLVTVAP